MGAAEELDPSESVLFYYATEFRAARRLHGVSQREMARQAYISPSLLNKVESGRRLPTEDLSQLADHVFGTGDRFHRLWHLVMRYAYPTWFQPYVDLEGAATVIRSFQTVLLPGLFQTERYARAVLAPGRPDSNELDNSVTARLERQGVLAKKNAPEFRCVLDESAIRRPWGGKEVMREQLERVIEFAQTPHFVVQVIPFEGGGRPGGDTSFSTLSLDEGPDVVYVDGFLAGQVLAEPEHVAVAYRTHELLMAEALSPARSLDFIASALRAL